HHDDTLTGTHAVADVDLGAHDHARHWSAHRLRTLWRAGACGHRADRARPLIDDLGADRPAVDMQLPLVAILVRDERYGPAVEQQMPHGCARQCHDLRA